MKLEKAIEITNFHIAEHTIHQSRDITDALKLGIEALKRVEEARVKGTIWNYSLLPGETRDDEP